MGRPRQEFRRRQRRGYILSGFSPRSVPGLVAWYDANSAYITKDGSNRVSAWNDRSGAGLSADQATAANQPLWVGSAIGNRPAIYFDGAASPNHDILATGNVDLSSVASFTWFAVVKDNTAASSIFFEKGTNTGANPGMYGIVNNGAVGAVEMGWNGGGSAARDYRCAHDLATPVLVTARVDATQAAANEMTMRLNGVDQPLTVVAGAGVETGTGYGNSAFYFGARSGGTFPWKGWLAEFLLYTSALSAADVSAIEAYLAAKYSLHETLFSASTGSPIVFMGDSLTRGEVADVGGYRKPAQYLFLNGLWRGVGTQEEPTGYKHEGNNGETLVQMNTSYATRWGSNSADVLVLMGGTNDMVSVDGPTALTNLDTLLTTVEGTAPVPSRILVASVPPNANATIQSRVTAFNSGLSATLATHATAELVDFASTLRHDATSPVLDADGTHLFEWAYEDMAHVFASAVLGSSQTADITDPDEAGLEFWFRADTSFAAAQWNDLSGNGRHLLQASAPLQLSTTTGSLGKTCVTMNGTGYYQTAAFSVSPTQPTTIIVVGKVTTAGDPFVDGIGASNRNAMYALASTGLLSAFAGTAVLSTSTDIRGTAGVYTGVFNGTANSLLRENQKAMARGSTGTNVLDGLTVAAYRDGSTPATGELYEVIGYSGVPKNLRAIEQKLRNNYGI